MLRANRINPEGLTREDAEDIADVLVATGRAISRQKWVTSLREKARQDRMRSLPHNQL